MSSAQISEQETKPALPVATPQKSLPEPEKPKGSGFRKWIVVLVIALAVGAAVWKIRKNSQEQVTQGQKMAAALDRPTPVQVVAGAAEDDADLSDGAGDGDGVQHGDDQVAGGRTADAGECDRGAGGAVRASCWRRSIRHRTRRRWRRLRGSW